MKRIYLFSEGNGKLKSLLGGKGANLAEMNKLGLPIPPGVIITTDAWREYYTNNQTFSEDLKTEIIEKLKIIEKETRKVFGRRHNQLLVSVRSGAPVSMPGMMDTILNLGLNDETINGFVKQTRDERFGYDCYRRFIGTFGRIVLGVEKEKFEEILEDCKYKLGFKKDLDLDINALKEIIKEYKALVEKEVGKEFPNDVYDQLFLAVKAVFDSWFTPRAVTYRQANKIPDDLGTAVIIQAMVFGNMCNDSGTGVMFTRDPSTGEKRLYGECLLNAQGEDLVAGIRTPEPIDSLHEKLPKIYDELVSTSDILERHFRDMQDVEFTIEKCKLYILQTRAGKRTPQAAAKIAFDMYKDGMISREEAIRRINSIQLQELILQQKDSNVKVEPLAKGLPASPGIATGIVVLSSDEARKCKEKGENVILVRPQTSPEDIQGILSAEGILTTRGGMTSHAAIVTRSLSKPCIVGCEEIKIDPKAERFYVKKEKESKTIIVTKGEVITIDGTRGEVILGEVSKVVQRLSEYVKELLAGM